MKTYTLCGSMRFEKQMQEIAFYLETQKGFNILQCTYAEREVSEEEKQRITAAHYQKINLSDGIYVLNIDGYVGDSVAKEIMYAEKQGKEIMYYVATTAAPKPPLCKGRWHGEAVTEGL